MLCGKGWVAIDEDDEYTMVKTKTTEGKINVNKVSFYLLY